MNCTWSTLQEQAAKEAAAAAARKAYEANFDNCSEDMKAAQKLAADAAAAVAKSRKVCFHFIGCHTIFHGYAIYLRLWMFQD